MIQLRLPFAGPSRRLLGGLLALALSAGACHAAEIIVDNDAAVLTGSWNTLFTPLGFHGANYLNDKNSFKGSKNILYTPNLPSAGTYEVFARWMADPTYANNVPIDINHAGGTTTVTVNQQANGGAWVSLGSHTFAAGTAGSVRIRNNGTTAHVIADAVRFVGGSGGTAINLASSHDFVAPGNITANASSQLSSLASLSAFQALGSANRYVYSFETWPIATPDLGASSYTFEFDLDGDGIADQKVNVSAIGGANTQNLTQATIGSAAASPTKGLGGLRDLGWSSSAEHTLTFSKPVSAAGFVYRCPTAINLQKIVGGSNFYPVSYTLTDGTIVHLGASGVLGAAISANTNTFVSVIDPTGKGIVSLTTRVQGTINSSQYATIDDLAFVVIPEPAVANPIALKSSRDFADPAAITASASTQLAGLCSLADFRALGKANRHVYSFNTWPQAGANLPSNNHTFNFDLNGDGVSNALDQQVTANYTGTQSATTVLTKATVAGTSSPAFALGGLGDVGGTAYAEHRFTFQKPVAAVGFVYHSSANLKLQRTGGFPISYTLTDGSTVNLGASGALGATLAGNTNTFVGLIDPTGKGITSITARVMGSVASPQYAYIDDLAFLLAGPPPGDWRLILDEQFTGNTLNTDIWSTGYRWSGSINNELQAFRPENVVIGNGLCSININMVRGQINHAGSYAIGTTVVAVDGFTQAIPNGATVRIGTQVAGETKTDGSPEDRLYVVASSVGGSTPTQLTLTTGLRHAVADNTRVVLTAALQDMTAYETGNFDYRSGAIQSYNKWTYAYGYAEARIKMASGAGTWPAFWLMPDRGTGVVNLDNRVGTNEPTGFGMGHEVDIMEYMGTWKNPTTGVARFSNALHWTYGAGAIGWFEYAKDNEGYGPQFPLMHPDTQFHTYACQWSPQQIVFYVDGKVTNRYTTPAMIANVPHYIILACAVTQSDWTGTTVPIANIDAGAPSKMEIDYVKIWADNTLPPVTEVILDNTSGSGVVYSPNATSFNRWLSSPTGFYGTDYVNDKNSGKGSKTVRFTPNLVPTGSGSYQVYGRWPASASNANNVPIDITHAGGTATVTANQQANGGAWVLLGTYTFTAGAGGNVLIRTTGTTQTVVIDAIRFVKQ